MRPNHHSRFALPLVLAAGLSACASAPQKPAAAEADPVAAAKADAEQNAVIIRSTDPQDYRFHMSQDGRRMSADEFEAWMKARGIRIATGKPGQAPADTKADGRDEQRNN